MSDNRLLYDRNVVPASPPPRSLSERCTDGVGELLSPSSMPQSAFASSPFGRAREVTFWRVVNGEFQLSE